MELLGILLTVAFIGVVVAVNVWHRRYLARLSPEDRAKEEEAQRRDSSRW